MIGMERWFIGLKCPEHGHSEAWRPEWQLLIEEVIEAQSQEGSDIVAAPRALCTGPESASAERELDSPD